MTMALYLVDIDGTIADNKHREWVLKEPGRPRPNWDLFFNMAGSDKPVPHMQALLFELRRTNDIVYVTGRPERLRGLTMNWLREHKFPVPAAQGVIATCHMYMRKDGDHRPDDIVKGEMLDAVIADHGRPLLAFDDRNSVVAMWRKRGVPCLQVAEGDF
jgi:hypothetical protein